jgi:hypothetical protein
LKYSNQLISAFKCMIFFFPQTDLIWFKEFRVVCLDCKKINLPYWQNKPRAFL